MSARTKVAATSADVLKVLLAAVADAIRPAHGDRLDGLGRLAGHSEVATDAVDRPGPQADAGDAVVEPVDAGIQLVADLESTVVRKRGQADLVADRRRCLWLRRDRAPRRSSRRRLVCTWSLSASAASNTARVPITLTFAPRIGLARQVGVCRPAR